jgi:TatD DNase family protein
VIFDTHCHLGYDDDVDPAAVHERARAAGVRRLLDVGIDLASSRRARAHAVRLDGVCWSAGLHPNDAGRLDAEWDELAALAREPGCVAIGETGLDFHREWTTPQQQAPAFERHLQLAVALDKPVIVHCRKAFDAVFDLLARYPGVRGVMHCFSGGPAEAERALALGMHLSFAAPITYPRSDALRAAARLVPDGRLLVETDAPFLPPQERRGQRNEPAWIVATVARLAAERGSPFAALAEQTARNASALFGVPVA